MPKTRIKLDVIDDDRHCAQNHMCMCVCAVPSSVQNWNVVLSSNSIFDRKLLNQFYEFIFKLFATGAAVWLTVKCIQRPFESIQSRGTHTMSVLKFDAHSAHTNRTKKKNTGLNWYSGRVSLTDSRFKFGVTIINELNKQYHDLTWWAIFSRKIPRWNVH